MPIMSTRKMKWAKKRSKLHYFLHLCRLKIKTIENMKVISKLILAFLFIVSTASAQTVDEVIAKHIEAMGGSAKLNTLKTIKMTSNMDMMGMKLPITTTVVDKKASRTEVVFQGMTQVMVSDGETGWIVSPFQGKTEPEKANEEMMKQAKEERDITGPL